MANITFAVDERALAQAKAFAAESGTTLNKLVNSFLGSVGAHHPRPAVSEAERACLDYSLGRQTMAQAADALGLADAGLFLALMRQTGLPMPRLGEEFISRQADATYDVFREAMGLARPAGKRKASAQKGTSARRR